MAIEHRPAIAGEKKAIRTKLEDTFSSTVRYIQTQQRAQIVAANNSSFLSTAKSLYVRPQVSITRILSEALISLVLIKVTILMTAGAFSF